MGNARDAAEERTHSAQRRECQGPTKTVDGVGVDVGDRAESIWGCLVAKQALSNQSRVKRVQFPDALGLDILFCHLYTAQIP